MNLYFKTVLITAIISIIILPGKNINASDIQINENEKQRVISETETLIQKYLDLKIFSGVVLIADDGKPFYQKAFGLADRENNINNTLDTKFNIGSMNKTFTSTIILQLSGEGKLSLNENMGKYLPGFSEEASNKVTLKHLLEHKSGFGDYHTMGYFELPPAEKTIPKITERLKQFDLMFEPGSRFSYSNAGYIILGAVIEKVTGKSYSQNVQERILDKLNLKNTFVDDLRDIPKTSENYIMNLEGDIQRDHLFFSPFGKSDGGFYSTASDLLKFYTNLYYKTDLLTDKEKSHGVIFKWLEKAKEKDWEYTAVAGGFQSGNTVFYEIPSKRISVIVLANMGEPVAERLGDGIIAVLKGEDPADPQLGAEINVYKAYKEKGYEYVKNNFEDLTKNWHPGDPKDIILNSVGYEFLFSGKTDEAIKIFQLNTELFPDVANCFDSLGEAFLKKGDKKMALKNYKKALQLEPNLPSALEKVKELE